MKTIERRLETLEATTGDAGEKRRIVVISFPDAQGRKQEPIGISPYGELPSVDRKPGEDWALFLDRLRGMVTHLPAWQLLMIMARYSDA
jgi:hypothetical protein